MRSHGIAILAAVAVVLLSAPVPAQVVEPTSALKACGEIAKRVKAGVKPIKLDKSSSLAARCAAAGQNLGLLQAARVLAEVCGNEGGKEIWAAYAKTVDFALKVTLEALATDCK
jgi:hypothetical protein